MKIFTYCTCSAYKICPFCLQLSIIAVSAVFGISLIIWPKKAIDMQILFYRIINWKLEPISMEKEIRNTRIMGAIMCICSIVALVYVIIKQAI